MEKQTPRRRLRLPSPAMVLACIALAIALSGASYAAIVLPRNSVGTPQLKRDAVVTSKVKNRSLRAVDFALGQLPAGATGPAGPAGPAGAQGPKGDKGDQGEPATKLFAVVNANGTLGVSGGVVTGLGTHKGSSPGIYTVQFNRLISTCVPVATVSIPWGSPPGTVPQGYTTVSFPSETQVSVLTTSKTGAPTDMPFNLAVFC